MNNNQPYYPNLEGEISKRGILKKDIAKTLGLTNKALSCKLTGRVDFWYREVCILQSKYFPDVSKDTLFKHN